MGGYPPENKGGEKRSVIFLRLVYVNRVWYLNSAGLQDFL